MKNDIERFMNKIKIDDNGCWIWQAFKEPKSGYGRFKMNKFNYAAHRASWVLFKGEIPKGILACHRCDVPSCVNPEHLFLGTHKENSQDRDTKQRSGTSGKFGFLNPACKLTNEQMLKIKEDSRSQVKIAKDFGVSQSSVWRIKNGEQRRS